MSQTLLSEIKFRVPQGPDYPERPVHWVIMELHITDTGGLLLTAEGWRNRGDEGDAENSLSWETTDIETIRILWSTFWSLDNLIVFRDAFVSW